MTNVLLFITLVMYFFATKYVIMQYLDSYILHFQQYLLCATVCKYR